MLRARRAPAGPAGTARRGTADVEIVGFHPHETLFDPRHRILAGEDVWPSLIAWSRGRADQTSAFAGQIIFSPPVRDITADPFLAQPVIDRGVDVIDSGVDHLAENGFRLGLGDVAGARGSSEFHRSIAQGCDLQPGPPKLSFCYGHSRSPPTNWFNVRSFTSIGRMVIFQRSSGPCRTHH